ncbi:CBU_0592 family membrane protein [Actinomyces israelii]|nr:hypothetical protein AIF0345_2264 [Actinomyces israelii]
MIFSNRGLTIFLVNDMASIFITVGGWIGAAELLLAYALISKGRIAGDSLRYQALNLTGSVLLVINCGYTGAWPSVIANSFYVLVGINILMTVKRAYIAQLAHNQRAVLGSRLRRRRIAAAASGVAAVKG